MPTAALFIIVTFKFTHQYHSRERWYPGKD
jgi:hypothetical protein